MLTANFLTELSHFSKANWWVYIAYVLLLGAVFFSGAPNLIEVALVPSLHFIADVFIMMMFSAYLSGEYREGTRYQIISMLIFLSVKVYTGFQYGAWHYLAADPIYILAAIKNYRRDALKKDLRFVNNKTMTAFAFILITAIILASHEPGSNITLTPARFVQMGGIFLFAIALTTTDHERQRYELSMIALMAMVVGSGWELLDSLKSRLVAGLALSYFLLPLTVLVFYSKKWSYYMGHQKLV